MQVKEISVNWGAEMAAFTHTYTLQIYMQQAIRMPGPSL